MPELVQTFKSMQKSESDKRKFLALLQGVDLGQEEKEEEGPTFEDIQRRAQGINAAPDDVLALQGSFAASAGFGINMGLGYQKG
jgi:hypothetical protein